MGSDQSADAPALRVEHLVKIFRHPQGGDLRAVDDVTFEVERGGIFGLLGPNGAGKTTTLEIIEGIQPPDSGNIRVLGIDSVHDPDGIKRLMGVQLQTSAYPERLRLLEILDFLGVLYGKRTQSTKLLEWVGLSDRGESVLSKLSGGRAAVSRLRKLSSESFPEPANQGASMGPQPLDCGNSFVIAE